MIYHVTVDGRTFEIDVALDGVRVDGRPVEASLHAHDGSPIRALQSGHRMYPMIAARVAKGRWGLRVGGERLEADVVDERTKAIRDMAGVQAGALGPRPIVAPMPGMVLRLEVAEGDQVSEGQGVVIVEAMKMENELCATGAGVVSRVLVREGEAVEKDQVLVELTAHEASA